MGANNPLVSVIISVYNTEKYIKEAIESILNQTYQNLELIILNDGSTDSSADIIQSIHDDRIVFINNSENYGLLYELNYGISIARGEFIARLDSDDISYPNRIERQVEYLDKHKEVVLVGTLADNIIDGRVEKQKEVPISTFRQIKFSLAFGNFVFAHSSFMMRKEVLQKNNIQYEKYLYSQDYQLMAKLSKYGDIACLSEVLIGYRVHSSQASQTRSDRMIIDETDSVRMEYIESLDISEKARKALKYGVFRKLNNRQKVINFLEAFNEYAKRCNLTDNKIDFACKKYIFSQTMNCQQRTWGLFIACLDKRVRKLLDAGFGLRFMGKCIMHYSPLYVETALKL